MAITGNDQEYGIEADDNVSQRDLMNVIDNMISRRMVRAYIYNEHSREMEFITVFEFLFLADIITSSQFAHFEFGKCFDDSEVC